MRLYVGNHRVQMEGLPENIEGWKTKTEEASDIYWCYIHSLVKNKGFPLLKFLRVDTDGSGKGVMNKVCMKNVINEHKIFINDQHRS